MFDPSLHLDQAPPALLSAAARVDRYIARATRADLEELGVFLADTRAAWIEATNVARAHGCAPEAEEALGVVSVYAELLASARGRLAAALPEP